MLASAPALAQDITGPARVIDGDTIEVADQRIRLHDIDAPEKAQTCQIEGVPWACGIAAWGELVQLVAGRDLTCETRDIDRYQRVVAVCAAEGEDINAVMVAQGWALAYRQFSGDYVAQEGEAREAHLGMWRGDFVPAWEWRRGGRLAATPANDNAVGQCLIKGNISSGVNVSTMSPGGQSRNTRTCR
ncbi:MAG: thermonuclease family protein, partial [Proteobacteria bacterium]|nr:thermonuclease family protein [Pseudomonadota bacterium]